MMVGASTADRDTESLPKIDSRGIEHEPAPDGAVLLEEQPELAVFGGVGALGQIVGANPDVAAVELRALEVHAQDLIARQRVVDAAAEEVVVGGAFQRNVAGDLAKRRRGVEHGR